MKIFETADIRNIALTGHSGCGKTTLAEAMLFTAGAITRQGRVADGSSALDFVPEEQKRHTGIFLSLAQFEYEGKKINLLDCPGYADFVGEVYAGISAADSGVIVVSSTAGVEPETERVFHLMTERSMPRFFVINQMDKDQADFGKVLGQIRDLLTDRVVPLFYPIGSGPTFSGIVDVMAEKAYTFGSGKDVTVGPVPADLQAMIEDARGKLVELAAESDDAYLEKYLETLELSPEETLTGLCKGIAQGKIYPVLPMSAEKNRGTQAFLRMMTTLAPAPTEVAGVPAHKSGSTDPVRLTAAVHGPLAAHIFKISSEIMAQETALIRVHSGTLASGSEVYNSSQDASERIGQLYHFMGKERSDAERLVAGDIGAAAKLKSAGLNDTLSTKDQKLIVTPIHFPKPVHEMAVRSKKQGDEEKVGTAFGKLKDEDPTFQIEVQSDLHQTLIRAMGDQHVDVIVERLAPAIRRGRRDLQAAHPLPRDDPRVLPTSPTGTRSRRAAGASSRMSRSRSSRCRAAPGSSSWTRSWAASSPRSSSRRWRRGSTRP